MRYLTEGTRLSVQVMRYDDKTQRYRRNGQTFRLAVGNAKEADAFWRYLRAQIEAWEPPSKKVLYPY